MKDTFVKALQVTYKGRYESLQSMPYVRYKLLGVEEIFVDPGVELKVDETNDSTSWERLDSYHGIINDERVKSKRRVLEGEPGYGKSTLTQQLAYDWCNGVHDSPLCDIEILLIIQLRHMENTMSIFKAIKDFLMPKEMTISERHIKTILSNCKSVFIILEGLDEYPHHATKKTVILNRIKKDLLPEHEEIITTRLPHSFQTPTPQTARLRLAGLDGNAWEDYLRKAVAGNDDTAVERIRLLLHNNLILSDICKIPIFFVIFAHMSHEKGGPRQFLSATSLFRCIVSTLHDHQRSKQENGNVAEITQSVKKIKLSDDDHRELSKLAFDSVYMAEPNVQWNKQLLCKRLGVAFVEKYIRLGILRESEEETAANKTTITVSFYHTLFCQWYAAHHLAELLTRPAEDYDSDETDSDIIDNIDTIVFQYFFRFACGLNSVAAEKIINQLKIIDDGVNFAILCTLEQGRPVDSILETLNDIGSETVQIGPYETMLMQTSMIQLLIFASNLEVPITSVWINAIFESVDTAKGEVSLSTGLKLPALLTVEELWIEKRGKEFTEKEVFDIFQYAANSKLLKRIKFSCVIVPESLDVPKLSAFRERNVEVVWSGLDTWFILDLKTGQWQNRGHGTPLPHEGYEREVEIFREFFTW